MNSGPIYSRSRCLTAFALSLALCFLLSACGGRPEASRPSLRETYAQVESGMTLDEVEKVLGPGRTLTLYDDLELHIKGAPPGASRVWQDGETSITVAFIEGKVAAKLRAVAPVRNQ